MGRAVAKRSRGRGIYLFLVLPLIAVGVVAFAVLGQGQRVDKLHIGPDGSFELGFTEKTSPSAVREAQPAIKQRSAELTQQAQQQASPDTAGLPNVSGSWTADNGATYAIQQYGDRVVIQELSPYGVTGIGQGVVEPDVVRFSYQAVNGVQGQGELTGGQDAQHGIATFQATTGQTTSTTLTRTG